MTKIFWYLPAGGSDGRYLGTQEGARVADFDYLQQVAQAADKLGFQGALLPTGRFCEDAWVLASALLTSTQRLKFLVAFRPGLVAPALAARTAATFDHISKGRLLVNIVTGGSDADANADGLYLDHDTRYDVTDEFLSIYRRLIAGEEVTYEGQHLKINGGKLVFPQPVQKPYPGIYFGGSSDAAQRVAANHADVYLQWAEPPAQAAEQIAKVRRYAEEAGRTVKFGLRLHIIVRETESAAWDAANALIKYVDDKTIAAAQQAFGSTQAIGQQRMQQLHNGARDKLEVSPNLWAGVGLVRGGAGTAFVGDPKTIARRIEEYAEIGVDRFILSGYPHLEEAYRTAELLFPHLQLDHDFDIPDQSQVTNGKLASKDWDYEFGRSVGKTATPQR